MSERRLTAHGQWSPLAFSLQSEFRSGAQCLAGQKSPGREPGFSFDVETESTNHEILSLAMDSLRNKALSILDIFRAGFRESESDHSGMRANSRISNKGTCSEFR
jgi:hypothetical protein